MYLSMNNVEGVARGRETSKVKPEALQDLFYCSMVLHVARGFSRLLDIGSV